MHRQGKWSAPHFTAKARIMDYAKEMYPDMIGVFPSVCAFYTNWIERIRPKYAACTGLPSLLKFGAVTPDARCLHDASSYKHSTCLYCVMADCLLLDHHCCTASDCRLRSTACDRRDEQGVLVFSMPFRGDAVMPWVNPMTALGPVGARSTRRSCYTFAADTFSEPRNTSFAEVCASVSPARLWTLARNATAACPSRPAA